MDSGASSSAAVLDEHVHEGSTWPVLLAAAIVLLLIGVLWPWAAIPGFLLFAVAVTGWIREDFRFPLPASPGHVRGDRWWAVAFLILGEVVLFGTLFTFYFWARGYAVQWPPPEIPPFDLSLVTVNTAFLLTSGWTAHQAQRFLERGDVARFRQRLVASVLLGLVFLLGQAFEYATAGFTPHTGSYGTAFFSLTGTHGFHVLVGLTILSSFWLASHRGMLGQRHASGVAAGILYWHFVDAVWVVLYAVVYLRWV